MRPLARYLGTDQAGKMFCNFLYKKYCIPFTILRFFTACMTICKVGLIIDELKIELCYMVVFILNIVFFLFCFIFQGSVVGLTVFYPLDTVRTRLQIEDGRKDKFSLLVAADIFKHEGLYVFNSHVDSYFNY